MAAIVLHDGNKHIPSTFDLQGGTATGMAFTNTKALPTNATTIGAVEVVDVLDGQSMGASGTNTAIVVTVPSVTGMIYRTRATFTYI